VVSSFLPLGRHSILLWLGDGFCFVLIIFGLVSLPVGFFVLFQFFADETFFPFCTPHGGFVLEVGSLKVPLASFFPMSNRFLYPNLPLSFVLVERLKATRLVSELLT